MTSDIKVLMSKEHFCYHLAGSIVDLSNLDWSTVDTTAIMSIPSCSKLRSLHPVTVFLALIRAGLVWFGSARLGHLATKLG